MRRILFVLLFQLMIEIVGGLTIDFTILSLLQHSQIIILNVFLTICCLLGCISMLKNKRSRSQEEGDIQDSV